jgi:membrane protease YdiL (CAAX protease family)
MILNKTFLLYIIGILVVALATAVPAVSWLSPLTYMVIFPLVAIWLWKSEGRSLWDLGYRFNQGWFYRLAVGLVFGLAIPIFFQVIQIVGGWITLSKRMDPIKGIVPYLVILLLKMILIVGIEEFVFRGFFLQALSRKAGIRLAVVLSSLLWGLGHLTSMVNSELTPALIVIGMTTFLLWGITLSLCYLRAGKSLWLPYGLHLGINLSFSLVGWPFIIQPKASQWWIGNPAWSPESGMIGVIVWLIFAVAMYRLTGKVRINKFTPS